MRKQRAFARLSAEEINQMGDWLQNSRYEQVRDRIARPRPLSFGVRGPKRGLPPERSTQRAFFQRDTSRPCPPVPISHCAAAFPHVVAWLHRLIDPQPDNIFPM